MRNLIIASLLLAACQKSSAPAPVQKPTQAPTAKTAEKGPLRWMADDYPAALAQARAEKKPIFLDAWAPWCHTCLSMQSYVFTDPALAPLASRFVWLAIDTEKPENAPVTVKFPVDAYPTFFVIDPSDESVAGRWLGSMSLSELRTFLDDAEKSVQMAHTPGTANAANDPLTLLRNGDRAMLAKNPAGAAKLYAAALAAAPAGWPRRDEALDSQLTALKKANDFSACCELAFAHLDDMGKTTSALDFAAQALDCADGLPSSDARVEKLRRSAAERLSALAGDPAAPLSADDRGDAYRSLWEAREKLGDPAGAKDFAEKRLAVLDAAAAKAPDPTAASTFDWARADTNLYLKRPDEAKRLLSASERALPEDYNPPARLARVHLEVGEYGEALAAVERALTKAYGPRKGSLLGLKADILEKQGRVDEARAAVVEQLALYQALPEGQKRPAAEEAAQKRLSTLARK